MTESARQYVEQKLAAGDRDFLLTRVFAAADQRRALSALYALRAELRGIPLEVRDPGVALTKIGWWHEEWNRLRAGRARHPVTRELQAAALAPPALETALAATAALVQTPSVDSLDEVDERVAALARPLAELEAQLGDKPPPLEDWQRIVWVGLLEDLTRLAAAGRAPVPLDLLAAEQIPRDGLAAAPGALDRLVRALAAELSSTAGPPRTHAGIYRAVQELKLARYRHGNRSPPPGLGRLWAAWRAARALRRGT